MSDELERIRALREGAPSPSDAWARQTRAELLAMAAEEAEHPQERGATAPGWLARWRERLGTLVAGPGRTAVAGAVVLVAVVAVGGVLTTTGAQGPGERVAGPDDAADPGSSSALEPDDGPAAATQPEDGAGPDPEVGSGSASGAGSDDTMDGGESLAASCEGEDGVYTIRYPEGWHTNDGDVAAPCQYFAERPVDLVAATGGAPEHPITIAIVPLSLTDATQPGPAEDRTGRTATTIAGREAVVVEATATGAGAMPEGTRSYRYLIALDGERTLQVAAHDLAGDGLQAYREVVDDMVGSLQFGDG